MFIILPTKLFREFLPVLLFKNGESCLICMDLHSLC